VELTRPRWRDLAQSRGTNIEARLDLASEIPSAAGIESELRDALTNLIFNAVDAMPNGGKLTLRTRILRHAPTAERKATPTHVVVEVEDTGMGMNEETRKRCLEPFFSTKGQRGTGLGLAMVYGTVQRHEGSIEIESEVGRGTTIRIVLPWHKVSPETADASTKKAKPLRKLHILFVDDEPLLRELMREILETEGHEVITADGGPAGLEIFQRMHGKGQVPDVVITDLGMPHLDGRELTIRLKAISPATPVIMMTGWGKILRDNDEIRAPVDALVSKPPKMAELTAALEQVIRRPRA
jgi:CheY-like chemotaxis protein